MLRTAVRALALLVLVSAPWACENTQQAQEEPEQDQSELDASLDQVVEVEVEVDTSEGCQSDADCLGDPSGLRCDLSTALCVQCLEDADCSENEVCVAATQVCQALPTGCQSHADCAADPQAKLCNPLTSACVQCLTLADCELSQLCSSQNQCENTVAPCASNQDCAALENRGFCELQSGQCVACLLDADCGDHQSCTSNVCYRLPCTSNAHCSENTPICNTADGQCVECLVTDDCRAGDQCKAVYCVDPKLCDHQGNTPWLQEALVRPSHTYYRSLSEPTDPCDWVNVDFYPGTGLPGAYPLASAPIDFNYATCETCVIATKDCMGQNCKKSFFAVGGVVNVSEWGGVGETFAGWLENLYLVEVTREPDSFVTTRVPGGETWCIEHMDFNAVVQ